MIRPVPLALLLLLAGPAGAATVVSVGDGGTLRVSDGAKRLTIRMACIDAPETAQRPYGAASRQRLQLAPVGSVVTLRPQTIDKYGRTVAEVFRKGPKRQPGDGEQRPGLRLQEVSGRLRWLRLPGG
jgi:endonuclease YncB( thermonuclease family)